MSGSVRVQEKKEKKKKEEEERRRTNPWVLSNLEREKEKKSEVK